MQEYRFHALPDLGAIRFSGPDAATFLQGQLTADLRRLEPGRSTLAAWCSPQGRAIALMHVAPTPDGFVAVLPRELCGPVAARLSRFVMRSKVKVEDISAGLDVAGVSGREAGSFERCDGVTALRLTVERDLLLAATRYPRAGVDVAEFMATKLVTVSPGMDLTAAARLMLEHRVGGLPVRDNGTLVGIVTESDIFRRFVELQGAA